GTFGPGTVSPLPPASVRRRCPFDLVRDPVAFSAARPHLAKSLISPSIHEYVNPQMNLTELKQKPISEVLDMAEQAGLEIM
ncbi:hypothetical protein, partial [Pseudomonas syringae group genomosp. 7]|uniref:hypothetical protein n=1 Tax=Pseudomonas syringae group genomosp. 7 TaxID=251699 RepID=UPI00377043E6